MQALHAARHGALTVTSGPSSSGGAVALLFGWLGCQDRLLAKYASLLHDQRAADESPLVDVTARAIARPYDLFFSPSNLRSLAREALTFVDAYHRGKPTILYYFSNGGAFVHEAILQELPAYSHVRVCATIFDSAPAFVSPHTGARAASEGIADPAARQRAYWAVHSWLHVWDTFAALRGGPNWGETFWARMRDDPLPCPSLYLYSQADRVTDFRPLEELIEARRSRHPLGARGCVGVCVDANGGTPSPHVGHLVTHPDTYKRQLADFLVRAVPATSTAPRL